MPLGLRAMRVKATMAEQEYQDKIQSDLLNLHTNPPHIQKLHSHMERLIHIIQHEFDKQPNATIILSENLRYVLQPPADERDGDKYWSPNMISRAKRHMGIRSIRKDAKWWWTRPIRDSYGIYQFRRAEVFNDAEKKIKKQFGYKTSAPALMLIEVMKRLGYDAHPDTVLFQMSKRYSRGTVIKAKSALGIVSFKDIGGDGAWHWLYCAPDVINFMRNILREQEWVDGKVPTEYVFTKAWEEYRWSRLLINISRNYMGEGRVVLFGKSKLPDGKLYDYFRLR